MNRGLSVLAVLVVTSAAMVSGAAAKMVSYEINGQRYSYSTNNIEQTRQARQRIEAAEAAAAARAKAEAERRGNPLSSVFGSAAEREAAQAEARLKAVMSGQEQAPAPVQARAAAPKAEPAPRTARAARPVVAADQTANRAPAEAKSRTVVRRDAAPEPASADEGRAKPARAAAVPKSAAPDRSTPPQDTGVPAVKSVSFDAATGIKTTFMSDGSVQEEPFDPGALPATNREQVARNGASQPAGQPDETTGSTQLPSTKAAVDTWSPFASVPRR